MAKRRAKDTENFGKRSTWILNNELGVRIGSVEGINFFLCCFICWSGHKGGCGQSWGNEKGTHSPLPVHFQREDFEKKSVELIIKPIKLSATLEAALDSGLDSLFRREHSSGLL